MTQSPPSWRARVWIERTSLPPLGSVAAGSRPAQRRQPDRETDARAAPGQLLAPVRSASLLSASTRRCASRRSFKIRLHTRKADPLVCATRTLRGRRLRATVNLRGLPKGTFKVKVQGVTRKRHRVRDLRTSHTCVRKRAAKK